MADKNDSEKDFLADVLGETHDNDFTSEDTGEDLFAAPKEGEGQVEEEEVYHKPVSYRKDEKLQRYIDKQVARKLKDFKPSSEETFKQDLSASGDDEIVSALTRLVGNDTDEKKSVLNDLKKALDKRDERASQKAYERLIEVQQEAEQEEEQEIEEAEDELEDGFETIEQNFGIDLTSGSPRANRLQNAYRDFLLSMEPRGGYQEYPDFNRTFELFKNSVKRSNSTAKNLASRGMERSGQVSQTEQSFVKKENNESLWQKLERLKG